ncbi:glycosyltransferase [Francisella adeliensis]|uniref:Glycosyl transferase n=1 Tax=Francisella adeliensis TaxID=2007306 RepID=A0A2Z4Y1E6_9GAMM|nr:glycosyl transferase [Francisella adeliensis]MBK2085421.1 glycosyltransferase [Francisella adeliensis]MBK2097151.1 glycosyltransferase [Francisella adeliensis]QIW12937.1 glycosyltransferase [Francisella adeliensis]QIW14816.1 glycosyltransferase [Francisella adeliensis]
MCLSSSESQSSTKNPLVTIITVVYNGGEFLESTIKSVINQSFKNYEYIIIDGGSSDGTLDIIKKYSSYISKWVSEPDNGIYDAMNKGIELANGRWLNFMNAGDSFYSNEVLEDVFENNFSDGIGVIYGNTDIGHKILKYKQSLDLKSMSLGMMLCHQSTFYRLNEAIRYNLEYKICGDQDFTMQYFYKDKQARYLDMTISKYDLDGISSQSLNKILKEKFLINKSYNLPYSPIIKSYVISILVKVRKLLRGH